MNEEKIIAGLKTVNETFKRTIIKLDMINIRFIEGNKDNQEIIKILEQRRMK